MRAGSDGVPGIIEQVVTAAPLQSRIVVVGVCMEPDTFRPSMAINKEVEVAELKRIAMRNGMKTLHQDSMLKVKMGLTTMEDALANVPPDLIL